ncbi:MAG: hypothetical protein GWN00_20360 [Aliifodinibius sp.]|nr:hypothetical protein [Fodinibius sp.]NIY27075.1 hypothetical protein [Fodinibius sp.]
MLRSTGLAFLAILVAGGCSWVNRKVGLEDDHALEEAIEYKIKKETGLDIDLTPESEE